MILVGSAHFLEQRRLHPLRNLNGVPFFHIIADFCSWNLSWKELIELELLWATPVQNAKSSGMDVALLSY